MNFPVPPPKEMTKEQSEYLRYHFMESAFVSLPIKLSFKSSARTFSDRDLFRAIPLLYAGSLYLLRDLYLTIRCVGIDAYDAFKYVNLQFLDRKYDCDGIIDKLNKQIEKLKEKNPLYREEE